MKNLINIFNKLSKKEKNIILLKDYMFTYFGNSTSELLAKLIEKLSLNENRYLNVYVPNYFCGQSLKYLRLIKINLIFYKLTHDLLPDYKNIIEISKDKEINVFILVHYFGRISILEDDFLKFIRRKKIFLIEDCAHVQNPKSLNKVVGDFVFFSPHKHFSIPQIGILISSIPIDISSGVHTNNSLWFLKKIIKILLFYKKKPKWGKVFDYTKLTYQKKSPSYLLQNISVKLMNSNLNNNQIILKRLAKINYIISRILDWETLVKFRSNEIPYLLPMLCKDERIAERRFNLLNKKNQIVMQWPDIPHELKSLNDLKKQTYDLVDRVIFFIIPNNSYKILQRLKEIELNKKF